MGICAVIVFGSAVTLFSAYNISWTDTSALFGSAALVLLFSLTSSHSKKTVAAICAVSGIFIVLNAITRFSTFVPVFPFYILAVVYVILKNRKKYSLKAHCALMGSVLVLSCALSLYCTMDSEYKSTNIETVSHSDFEIYRSQFRDYRVAPYEGNEDFYSSIGWDKDFYDMARQWMFMDRRFNTENLRKIAEMSHTQTAAVSSEKTKEAQKENIFE